MPELPEAEVARRTLRPCVAGKTIDTVLVARPQSIRAPLLDAVAFSLTLRNRTVESIDRRAKLLVFNLTDSYSVIFHFKLGADVRCRKVAVTETSGVAWNFTDGTALEFSNLALSEFHLARTEDLAGLPVLKSGIDPLCRSFSIRKLQETLPRGRQIKAALTDQEIIGGIGNTYSDEILWNSHISPFRKVSELTDDDISELMRQIKATLKEGIRSGGETGFTDAKGRHGRYQTKVHGKGGQPCPRDGHAISQVKRGRTTFWCPQCQV